MDYLSKAYLERLADSVGGLIGGVVPDWKAACVVEQTKDGAWSVVSPSGRYHMDRDGRAWYPFTDYGDGRRGVYGAFLTRRSAYVGLACAVMRPPDWIV